MMGLSTLPTLGECLAWLWQLSLSTEQRPAAMACSAFSPAADGGHLSPHFAELASGNLQSFVSPGNAVCGSQVPRCFRETVTGGKPTTQPHG